MSIINNYPRAFAYITGAFMIGILIYVLSGMFLTFTERPDLVGSLALLAYAFVYLNLNWVLSRRFTKKTVNWQAFPYLMATVMTISGNILIYLKEDFTDTKFHWIFFISVLAASFAGAWLGIRSGIKIRDKMPGNHSRKDVYSSLKRPHENLNRN